jgi:hypothetical protein
VERELLLIYCMVDDFCRQPQILCQLRLPGPKPKLLDEDDYWRYVWREFGSYFPGQLVDRSQYHWRKKGLSPLVSRLRSQLLRRLPKIPGYHVIDRLGSRALA